MEDEENKGKRQRMKNFFKKHPFKVPSGWVWILIGFIITNIGVYLNYNLAREAQKEPRLNAYYEKIDWPGAVLQPNLSKIDVCKVSHDFERYFYETNKMNRIRIRNSSSILAKRVRVGLKIDDKMDFIFSVITVEQRYAPGSDWRDVKIDRNRFKFIYLEIDSIKGDEDYCDIFFVYAYPRDTVIKKKAEKGALVIDVTLGRTEKNI